MAIHLNLLPENLQISKGVSSFLKTAKALSVILIVLFSVSCLVSGALLIVNKINLDNTQKTVEQLKTQVKAQEVSEMQLVLLRDRLAKITTIKNYPTANKNIASVDSLFSNLSPNTILNQANISSNKIDISLVIRSNEDLSLFLKNIKDSTLFKTANVSSLGYNPIIGYTLALTLGGK